MNENLSAFEGQKQYLYFSVLTKGTRRGGRGFPQAIMSMIPGYSNRKQKEIELKELLSCSVPRLLTNPQLEILVKALILIPRGARKVLFHPRGSNACPHTLQVSGLPAELVLTWYHNAIFDCAQRFNPVHLST